MVFEDVSCRVNPGQLILLRGANASGKTTLLNILTGHLLADKGQITLNGVLKRTNVDFQASSWVSPRSTPEGFARAGISRSWQEIRLFPNHTIVDNVAAAAQNQSGERLLSALFLRGQVRESESENQAQSRALLSEVGMVGLAQRTPRTLSLGESKRVAIVRAIHAGAKVLFLDEPLAGLDVDGVHDVLTLILDLVRNQGLSVVIVEHLFHIPRLLPLADTVWTLARGKLAVQSPSAVQEELLHVTPGIIDWLGMLTKRGYLYSSEPLPNGAVIHIARRDPSAATVLDIQGLCLARDGASLLGDPLFPARTGISLSLRQGDIALIEAPNGWGKTTLLETLAGMVPNLTGSIRLDGRSMGQFSAWDRSCAGMSLLRSAGASFPTLTTGEVFRLANTPLPDRLLPISHQKVGELSGGQQQLVNLLRLLLSRRARVRLLDEPLNMLDPAATNIAEELLLADPLACTLLAIPASVRFTTEFQADNQTDLQGKTDIL